MIENQGGTRGHSKIQKLRAFVISMVVKNYACVSIVALVRTFDQENVQNIMDKIPEADSNAIIIASVDCELPKC